MKRILFVPIMLGLVTLAVPVVQAQQPGGNGERQGQQLRKRDGSGPNNGSGRGQGMRKQDGTGPRAGTADCPKTPKAPAK
jgi:ABC-type microcin C transport system permease subunit YejB